MILARFLRLCSTILSTPSAAECAALIVNRISEIVPVDRAALARLDGKQPIQAITGGGIAAQDSAFADAIDHVRRLYRGRQGAAVVPPSAGEDESGAALRKVQSAMSGTEILWLPLWLDRDGNLPPTHALWLERWGGRRWERVDVEILGHGALFMGHAMTRPEKRAARGRKRMTRLVVAAVLLAALLLPVTASVTAPARIIPNEPHYVFAPMDGILKELRAQPGQRVQKDDILFRYDDRVLEKRLDEAYRAVAVARAKLARLEGAAYADREARAELPAQRLEVERAEADVEFYAGQLARAEVRAGQPGVVVLDDPDALIGAALQTGQAVLRVAEPDRTKIRIAAPASDVGFVKEGAHASIRLDSDPLSSRSAVITRVGFDIQISPQGVPSVMIDAIWLGDPPPIQPGQGGTAKIYGDSTILGMQILRKPIIKLRNLVGI